MTSRTKRAWAASAMSVALAVALVGCNTNSDDGVNVSVVIQPVATIEPDPSG